MLPGFTPFNILTAFWSVGHNYQVQLACHISGVFLGHFLQAEPLHTASVDRPDRTDGKQTQTQVLERFTVTGRLSPAHHDRIQSRHAYLAESVAPHSPPIAARIARLYSHAGSCPSLAQSTPLLPSEGRTNVGDERQATGQVVIGDRRSRKQQQVRQSPALLRLPEFSVFHFGR